MMTILHATYVGIIVAAIASLVWGWVWHNRICETKLGTFVAKVCGVHCNMNQKEFRIAILVSFIGALLTACVVNRLITVAQTANLMPTYTVYKYGFCTAFLVWLGFYVPMALNVTVWMKKNWHFFVSLIVKTFINLVIIAMILAYWATLK